MAPRAGCGALRNLIEMGGGRGWALKQKRRPATRVTILEENGTVHGTPRCGEVTSTSLRIRSVQGQPIHNPLQGSNL